MLRFGGFGELKKAFLRNEPKDRELASLPAESAACPPIKAIKEAKEAPPIA